ncbi:MAG: CoA ester lyase [Pseudomonadota bacterium]|nr:CoA ester lyase [Pseudomonadota bacterium]
MTEQDVSILSYLFVPGDSARKMEKALESGAGALILDLEDAVGPDAKGAARDLVAAFLGKPAPMPRLVRVNALDTGLTEADIAATAGAGPAGYVLPKTEGRDDIEALSRLMDRHGAAAECGVLVIATETVRAVRALLSQDWSHPRLTGMAWGGEDLAADLGATANRGPDGHYHSPFRFARDAMLFAAKSAGVAAIDSVFTDFRDDAGLAAEAQTAAGCGFDGKLAIHPAQIAPIHQAFTPTDTQIDWARRVVSAMAQAGAGVARLDGKMLDRPHLKQAQAILKRAEAVEGGRRQDPTARPQWAQP